MALEIIWLPALKLGQWVESAPRTPAAPERYFYLMDGQLRHYCEHRFCGLPARVVEGTRALCFYHGSDNSKWPATDVGLDCIGNKSAGSDRVRSLRKTLSQKLIRKLLSDFRTRYVHDNVSCSWATVGESVVPHWVRDYVLRYGAAVKALKP